MWKFCCLTVVSDPDVGNQKKTSEFVSALKQKWYASGLGYRSVSVVVSLTVQQILNA